MEGLIALVVLAVLAVPVLLVVLLVTTSRLRARVADVEAELARLRYDTAAPSPPPAAAQGPTLAELMRAASRTATPDAAAPAVAPVSSTSVGTPVDAAPQSRPSRVEPSAASVPPPLPPRERPAAPAPAAAARPHVSAPYVPPPPGPLERAFDAVRRWFTEGNVPVKVGIVVLFAGVAALLKYASDQGLLRVPIELRLAGVAFAAIAALVFGWRQRFERRAFGLAVQGGAVGVLLLVLFAASKLYPLMPMQAAFAGSVALVAGLGVLAVRQDSLALAVLGVLAGFLAPIWLSTGEGNHVALFSYYAVLNAGIVAMAWRRPWRLLNLMGFAFTFGIGSLWGALRYRPEDFATTEPFLVLFFAMYLAIPILYAAAKGPAQRRIFDGSLVFGTPLVAFALQAGLLRGDRMTLAFCALGLAAVYAALAGVLRRRATFEPLVAPYAVLAVGFATLAVPLALSARATAAVFALEGAGLVWLGLRQDRLPPRLAGIALQFLAAFAFASGLHGAVATPPVLNAVFMTALLIAIGGFATAAAARRHRNDVLATAAYLWGLAWWLGLGFHEIDRGVSMHAQADVLLAFVLGTGWLASEVARRAPARALSWTSTLALFTPLVIVWIQRAEHGQPLAGWGLLPWALLPLMAWRVLSQLRDEDSPSRPWAHMASWGSFALLASISLFIGAQDAQLADAWRYAGAALPWLLLAGVIAVRPDRLAPPFEVHDFEGWRDALGAALSLVLAAFFCIGLVLEASTAPLPHIPLVNPAELVQLATLLLAFRALDGDGLRPVVAGAAFAFATSVVLRATHHWGGVPWSPSMFSTGAVQTALTVLWSVIGMLAWVAGSRRHDRAVWQVGAVLLAVVLGKLVLVDRQYLGNLLGIGSFIAFGLLCTAVGYLAPVPPRDAEAAA